MKIKFSALIEVRKALYARFLGETLEHVNIENADFTSYLNLLNEDAVWRLTGGFEKNGKDNACRMMGVPTISFGKGHDTLHGRNAPSPAPQKIVEQMVGQKITRKSVIMWEGAPFYIAMLFVSNATWEHYSPIDFNLIITEEMEWSLDLMPCSVVDMDI